MEHEGSEITTGESTMYQEYRALVAQKQIKELLAKSQDKKIVLPCPPNLSKRRK